MKERPEDTFEIKLPLFEGPFDLLLFFIERDELDIHDIPISEITEDFLGYLHQLEQMNVEVASEFILVAATLMRIKAKMLLPRVERDEDGNEIEDDWKGGNGYLHDGRNPDYIHWFNTYPLEMGEFLFETTLRHGTYIHAVSANDAMYQRADVEVQFGKDLSIFYFQ